MSGKKIKQFKRQLRKGQYIFANEFINEMQSRKLKERLLIGIRIVLKTFNKPQK